MKSVLKAAIAAGSVILALAAASPAQAQTPATSARSGASPAMSAELRSYLQTVPANQRDEFVRTKVLTTVEMTTGGQVAVDAAAQQSAAAAAANGKAITPMAYGCWTQRWSWAGKALAGNTLYTYYHVGGWCASGTSVTRAWEADSGGQTYAIGWRYEGVVKRSSGIVSNQGRSYTQHKFVLGAGGWDVQTSIPCGRVKGYYNATSGADGTCGIY